MKTATILLALAFGIMACSASTDKWRKEPGGTLPQRAHLGDGHQEGQ